MRRRAARSAAGVRPTALLPMLLAAFLLVGCAGVGCAGVGGAGVGGAGVGGAGAGGAGAGGAGVGGAGAGTAGGVLDPVGVAARPGAPAVAGCPAPSPTAPGAAESRLPLRSLCALPAEATRVWRTIAGGGRPAYPKDGSTFGNIERRLPRHDRGYYREYTVPTPGSADRGARRLISGNGHELYYTGDHYGSFVVVDPTAGGPGS